MPGNAPPPRRRLVVPSADLPTVGHAVAASPDGAIIDVLPGHYERLNTMVLDQPFVIEGPADRSATLVAEHGIVCAARADARGTLILRNMTLRSTLEPVLTITRPCSVEFCDISGSCVGVQVMVGARGEAPYFVQNAIHDCADGLCFVGGLHCELDRNRVEGNGRGVVVVGLELPEGPSEGLAALDQTHFAKNSVADLQLVALMVRDSAGAVLRCEGADSDILIPRFGEARTVVVPGTEDRIKVLLRLQGLRAHVSLGGEAELCGVGTLTCRGRWCTGPLPAPGSRALLERQRDFARLVAPDGQQAFIVVAPGASAPSSWTRQAATISARTDVGGSTSAAAAAEQWLEEALIGTPRSTPPAVLADRCVSLLCAGEGIGFALAYDLTPALLQP
eukprot:CAMPEP_0117535502 /NCGR_PEP_ID=MMETSP0784-20121206/40967_1 /TAXON_ID=39447 /ORGANISM="" /LENGTH=391 /DNA_ID=CAMNT_0005332029 /DNA_START=32 /DNA_END=1204 /DNA_ORIENTATION=-